MAETSHGQRTTAGTAGDALDQLEALARQLALNYEVTAEPAVAQPGTDFFADVFRNQLVHGIPVKVDRDEVLLDLSTPAVPPHSAEVDHIREMAGHMAGRFPALEAALRYRLIQILARDISALLTKEQVLDVIRTKKMHHGRETQPFTAPAPETDIELGLLGLQHDDVVQTTETLSRAGVDPSEYQMNALRDLGEQYTALAKSIGLHAIAEGRMTQVAMARAYGVRPATVNSWVNEARDKNKNP